jgi:hypothetical protein
LDVLERKIDNRESSWASELSGLKQDIEEVKCITANLSDRAEERIRKYNIVIFGMAEKSNAISKKVDSN